MKLQRVEITQAGLDQRETIANLMQLYLHDFSEFAEVAGPYGEVGEDGRFRYDWLEGYWDEDERRGRIPFLILAEGRLAGFALINKWSALGRPLDRSIAEFFILRKYRRQGVGARAASLLFTLLPGKWEAPVAFYNLPARAFWRKTIHDAIGVPPNEAEGDGERWNGAVFYFDNSSAR
jgi:predicted acetyltransferase